MIIVLLMESEILKMKLMKSLNLKDKFLKLPIIQGGMGIGVSRCRLAGAVAKEGGMGVLSTPRLVMTIQILRNIRKKQICVYCRSRSEKRKKSPAATVWSLSISWPLHSCMKPMSKPPVPPVWMPSSPEQDSRQNSRNLQKDMMSHWHPSFRVQNLPMLS